MDSIVVFGHQGYFALDDFTYHDVAASPTPEPAAWAMFIAGFGLIGGAMRRCRSVEVTFA